MSEQLLHTYLPAIKFPQPDSHKGQNGKVMVIGGSQLFHAASQWALTVVSRMVDMVFYASTPSNNYLVQQAKQHFANGIVIPREKVEEYINEAEVILIGPGMERHEKTQPIAPSERLAYEEWNTSTEKITNYLLHKYPGKKWVIDAGALQMLDPQLLTERMILTPHHKEFEVLHSHQNSTHNSTKDNTTLPTTVLLKGVTDQILPPHTSLSSSIAVYGGNQGMTKGGTGDVLAGVVAGLYCWTDDPVAAAVVASVVNKRAGEALAQHVGIFYNASDLAAEIPHTLAALFELKNLELDFRDLSLKDIM